MKAIKTGYGDSAWTTSTPCIVTLTCGAPSVIHVPQSNTTGSIYVAWSTSDIGGVTYILEMSKDGNPYTQVYSGTSTGTNVPVTSNGIYTFRVKAIKTGYGDSAWTTSTPCIVTLTCGAPSVIQVPQSNTTGSIYVAWSTSDIGGVTYILEMSKDGNPYTQVYSGTSTGTNVPVTSNGIYTFRLKAIKTGYGDSAWTTSTPCIVTLTCGAPSVIQVPQSNTTGSIYVAWSTSDIGGVTYILEMSKDGNPYTQVYSGTSNSTNVPVTSNGSYTFRLKAIKTGYGDSSYTVATNNCQVTLP